MAVDFVASLVKSRLTGDVECLSFSADFLDSGIPLGFADSLLLRRSGVLVGMSEDLIPSDRLNVDLGDTLEDDCGVSVLGRAASGGHRVFVLAVPGTIEK